MASKERELGHRFGSHLYKYHNPNHAGKSVEERTRILRDSVILTLSTTVIFPLFSLIDFIRVVESRIRNKQIVFTAPMEPILDILTAFIREANEKKKNNERQRLRHLKKKEDNLRNKGLVGDEGKKESTDEKAGEDLNISNCTVDEADLDLTRDEDEWEDGDELKAQPDGAAKAQSDGATEAQPGVTETQEMERLNALYEIWNATPEIPSAASAQASQAASTGATYASAELCAGGGAAQAPPPDDEALTQILASVRHGYWSARRLHST